MWAKFANAYATATAPAAETAVVNNVNGRVRIMSHSWRRTPAKRNGYRLWPEGPNLIIRGHPRSARLINPLYSENLWNGVHICTVRSDAVDATGSCSKIAA